MYSLLIVFSEDKATLQDVLTRLNASVLEFQEKKAEPEDKPFQLENNKVTVRFNENGLLESIKNKDSSVELKTEQRLILYLFDSK